MYPSLRKGGIAIPSDGWEPGIHDIKPFLPTHRLGSRCHPLFNSFFQCRNPIIDRSFIEGGSQLLEAMKETAPSWMF